MTELELLIDLHKNSIRQGPGSKKDTLKALGFLNFPKDQELLVADLGCGSGPQTITLAENLKAQITAVDLFPEFLNELNKRSQDLGLGDKIVLLEKSIDDLPFTKNEFDLIWAEGAIYNIGFEKGITFWKNFLRSGGYMAVSEITWITNRRPLEIEEYWINAYPEIDNASRKIQILEENNFTLVGYFYLDEESWIKEYYMPLQISFKSFLERHKGSSLARKIVNDTIEEINLYQKYKEYYSYGFYIVKKN